MNKTLVSHKVNPNILSVYHSRTEKPTWIGAFCIAWCILLLLISVLLLVLFRHHIAVRAANKRHGSCIINHCVLVHIQLTILFILCAVLWKLGSKCFVTLISVLSYFKYGIFFSFWFITANMITSLCLNACGSLVSANISSSFSVTFILS